MAGEEQATAHRDQSAADRDPNRRRRPAQPIGGEMPLLGALLARLDALPCEVACQQWVHRVLLGIERLGVER